MDDKDPDLMMPEQPEEEERPAPEHPDYKNEIAALIRSGLAPRPMRERLMDYHENDMAMALELLTRDERKKMYGLLDTATLANVFEYADEPQQYLAELTIRRRVAVLGKLEIPTVVEYLRQLSKEERGIIIELLDDDARREITLALSFDEDEIGSRMTTNYVTIHSGLSVREAMRELVDQAAENDNISTLYVIDQDGTLSGAIDLKDLIIARDGSDLDDIIMTSYPYVYAEEEIGDCIDRIRGYSEDSIPVLDRDNKLRGVLTAQEITELVDDAMGEDYAKLAGLTAEEDLEEPLRKSIGKRLPWLIVLLGLGLVVSTVVGVFEPVVSHLALIVAFQSLVLDMAGNAGTQSLAVTIRVLTDEQVSGKQKLFLVLKEARVGLLNGLILGGLSFVLIGGYLMLLKGQAPLSAFSMSFCTGSALMVAMLLSSISGTAIPLLFHKLNIDPAVASGPLITTLNDLVAVVTYYGLAWILLINVMGL